MAGMDKIYATYEQAKRVDDFLKKYHPKSTLNFPPDYFEEYKAYRWEGEWPIYNMSIRADFTLYKKIMDNKIALNVYNLGFIKDRLEQMYSNLEKKYSNKSTYHKTSIRKSMRKVIKSNIKMYRGWAKADINRFPYPGNKNYHRKELKQRIKRREMYF